MPLLSLILPPVPQASRPAMAVAVPMDAMPDVIGGHDFAAVAGDSETLECLRCGEAVGRDDETRWMQVRSARCHEAVVV